MPAVEKFFKFNTIISPKIDQRPKIDQYVFQANLLDKNE